MVYSGKCLEAEFEGWLRFSALPRRTWAGSTFLLRHLWETVPSSSCLSPRSSKMAAAAPDTAATFKGRKQTDSRGSEKELP